MRLSPIFLGVAELAAVIQLRVLLVMPLIPGPVFLHSTAMKS